MRLLGTLVIAIGSLAQAATHEKLSIEDMTMKSTEIVCGKVTASSSIQRGPVIYTRYHIQVSDRWKGSPVRELDVYVPGGRYANRSQQVSGAPKPEEGQEYMFFLWTSKSGLTQIIGLSQGLFFLKRDSKGEPVLSRAASSETMLDSSGKVVEDTPVKMRFSDLVDRIQRSLAGANR